MAERVVKRIDRSSDAGSSSAPASIRDGTAPSRSSATGSASAAVTLSGHAVRVDGFVRPFVIKQVEEMFATHGRVSHFWMNTLRSTALVTYDTAASAEAARAWAHGLKFPDINPKTLTAAVVPLADAEATMAAAPAVLSRPATGGGGAAPAAAAGGSSSAGAKELDRQARQAAADAARAARLVQQTLLLFKLSSLTSSLSCSFLSPPFSI
jgi:hypothetical protein